MPPAPKRKKDGEQLRRPAKKIRVKKQRDYHSSSEDDEPPVHPTALSKSSSPGRVPKPILKRTAATQPELNNESGSEADSAEELEQNTALNSVPADIESDNDSGEDRDDYGQFSDSDASQTSNSNSTGEARKKRNDPSAFATSISKILDTKLTSSKRTDPVLSRSKAASDATRTLADSRLEQRARAQIRAEKRQALEKGHMSDVLALDDDTVETGKVLEEEGRLKKTAQRGVVRLFNAVRAAQVQAEEGRRRTKEEGMVGHGQREERVNEMSKQGFLDLISRGGKETAASS